MRVRWGSTLAALAVLTVAVGHGAEPVPIIYTTDLYHPHDDPDDHFDLATLFAIPEFDIRAIVIDAGPRGKDRPGLVVVEQLMHLTGRQAPVAVGLFENLASPSDDCATQPGATQAGINLILDVLEGSAEPVTVFTTGSLRDVAAAYNRRPKLFEEKVSRLYINVGHSAGGEEHNVKLDRHSYIRVLRSGLPVYWTPCFGEEGYLSYWKFTQKDVLADAPRPVQNFIVYALTKADSKTVDPVEFLSSEPDAMVVESLWAKQRNMWCTGAFLDAAGRANSTFSYQPVSVRITDDGTTAIAADDTGVQLHTFHIDAPDQYPADMTRVLRELLHSLGR